MDYKDIDFAVGSVNPSGIADEVYFLPKPDISAWPEIANPEDADASVDTVACYTGDFTLVEGKSFKKLYNTQGKGKVTAESTGETDCKMYLNKATLSYPKINKESIALAKASLNGDFVFVVKHDGQFFIIGHPDYRNSVASSFDSGDAAGSAKGVTITLECPDTTPLPIYTGILPITGGSIDCSTGIFTPTPAG